MSFQLCSTLSLTLFKLRPKGKELKHVDHLPVSKADIRYRIDYLPNRALTILELKEIAESLNKIVNAEAQLFRQQGYIIDHPTKLANTEVIANQITAS